MLHYSPAAVSGGFYFEKAHLKTAESEVEINKKTKKAADSVLSFYTGSIKILIMAEKLFLQIKHFRLEEFFEDCVKSGRTRGKNFSARMHIL